MRNRPLLAVAAAACALGLAAPLLTPAPPAHAADTVRRIVHTDFDTRAQLAKGRFRGAVVRNGSLRIAAHAGTARGWQVGRWVSPVVRPGFALTELVPSWSGRTPGNSWVRVEVRGVLPSGRSSWDTISVWALDDSHRRRHSGGSQPDDVGRVQFDTWLTGGVSAYQLRVSLFRRPGAAVRPRIGVVGAMASRLPNATGVSTSTPGARGGAALGRVLGVPRYSQMVHRGSYPQYGGGGQAWCSPTSTAMALGYYDALPRPRKYAWVRPDSPDRVVPHLARMTYDSSYGGTGTWPFNTAYAASKTRKAFVTRLRSMREAERFIAAGIPLVISVRFGAGELAGAPISATNGHLLVVRGFTRSGDVVVNDPAAPSRASVRRTYDRGQLEDAWLKRYASGSSMRGSGGLAYVIHDAAHPLPGRAGNKRNW